MCVMYMQVTQNTQLSCEKKNSLFNFQCTTQQLHRPRKPLRFQACGGRKKI